jgi:hypothetical protein
MKPTKIAFDPNHIEGNDAVTQQLNEISKHMTVMLTSHLRVADLVRSCELIGNHALATEVTKGNELKVKFYQQMIDRFESLMKQGFGFSAALYQMRSEDWLVRLSNFESLE